MSYEHIRVSREDGIVTLAFNRPESRNSMTPAMGDEVVRAVEEIRADPTARVVVLTGSGKAFSSGGDLGMLARDAGVSRESDAPSMAGSPRDFYTRYLAIHSLPMPTIAAINGHAIGAGLCIALGVRPAHRRRRRQDGHDLREARHPPGHGRDVLPAAPGRHVDARASCSSPAASSMPPKPSAWAS